MDIAFILTVLVIYFLPAIIAFSKKKKNKGAIFAVNFFFGWSLIGWFWAFIWSLMND